MLEIGKVYSVKDFIKALDDFSYESYRRNKQKYNQYLARFYNFIIQTSGNKITYKVLEQYCEYIPYKIYKTEEKDSIVTKYIIIGLDKCSLQTGNSLSRGMQNNPEIQALKLKPSTLTKYVRKNLKKLIEKGYYYIKERKWCQINNYVDEDEDEPYWELSDEQVNDLKDKFTQNLKVTEEEINILSDYDNNMIEKEEAGQKYINIKYNSYKTVMNEFKRKYGIYPIKVPVIIKNETSLLGSLNAPRISPISAMLR